jgi:hypothetical protein
MGQQGRRPSSSNDQMDVMHIFVLHMMKVKIKKIVERSCPLRRW